MQRLPDRARADDGAEVQRLRLAADDPARLGRRVQRRGDEAGGHEDEHDARDAEEAREVQAHAAAVDPEAERDGGDEAEHDAEAGGHRIGRVVEGGEQEDRGLEALAQHGEEGHRDERHGRALGQRAGRLVLQLALEVAGVLGHPHDHVGDHRDRHERDDRSRGPPAGGGAARCRRSAARRPPRRTARRPGRRPATSSAARRVRPWRRRKAAMMPTMSEASRPSRRAITNVVSTASSGSVG